MKNGAKQKAVLSWGVTALAALAAGTVNGLLGTGGGIILTYLYRRILRDDPKAPYSAAMLSILPISFLSLFTYDSPYLHDTGLLVSLAISSAVGSIAGALLSDRAKPRFLEKLFAAVVIFAGARMLF